jgi:predicted methyltransferase
MMRLNTFTLASLAGLALMACGQSEPGATEAAPATNEAAAPVESALPAEGSLEAAAAGPWREDAARDVWRNPIETLRFFDVQADDTVVEIWPGGGWYTRILGPYLKSGGGTLYAAGWDLESTNERVIAGLQRYRDNFVNVPETFGTIIMTEATEDSTGMAPDGTVDVVLTFRNVHNWMSGGYAEKMFADAYKALKPGGVLGVVEHRLPSTVEQDPQGRTGYVHEDYVIQLAQEAGFVLEASSEVNANPKDTADHPFGVWTLPPNLRSSTFGEPENPDFDKAPYEAIGESDRMTLKFRKPE